MPAATDLEPGEALDAVPQESVDTGTTALVTALEDLLSWARRVVPPGELSLASTALLARLLREGSAGVTALAASEGVSQPAMSQMLARLERDGYVTRQAHPDDGRALVVALSDAGRRLVEGRRAERGRALAALLEGAPDGDAEALLGAASALGRLARSAQQQHAHTQQSLRGRNPQQ